MADLQARGEEEMTEVERVELARLYRELSESQLDIRVRTGDILDSDRSTGELDTNPDDWDWSRPSWWNDLRN